MVDSIRTSTVQLLWYVLRKDIYVLLNRLVSLWSKYIGFRSTKKNKDDSTMTRNANRSLRTCC